MFRATLRSSSAGTAPGPPSKRSSCLMHSLGVAQIVKHHSIGQAHWRRPSSILNTQAPGGSPMLPSVVAPSAVTPIEELANALNEVGPLHGLPFEERLWLASHGQEYHAYPGDLLFEEGAP